MDTSLKRIVAYVIDILIVTCVVSLFTNVIKIDPYREKYNESYNEYVEINKKVEDGKDASTYEDRIIELNYEINKYQVVSNAINISCLLLYFGVLQYFMRGQTIGKKFMKIKIESNKGKKLNIGNYLLRSLILNSIIFTLLNIIAIYVTKGMTFYYVTYVLSMLQTITYITIVVSMVFRNDNRGLHDIIAGTKVIDLNPVVMNNEIKEDISTKKESIKEKAEQRSRKKKKSVDK